MTRSSLIVGLLAAAAAAPIAPAQSVIHATGQLRIPGDPNVPSTEPEHYERYEQYV